MNIVDETGYKRMPSPLERMLLAGNKHESTDFLNKYVFLPGVIGGIGYAFYSFVSGFGNPNLTAMQQAKKMNGRVNGKISIFSIHSRVPGVWQGSMDTGMTFYN